MKYLFIPNFNGATPVGIPGIFSFQLSDNCPPKVYAAKPY